MNENSLTEKSTSIVKTDFVAFTKMTNFFDILTSIDGISASSHG